MASILTAPPSVAGPERRRLEPWLAALLLLGEFLWLVSRYTTATLPETNEDWVQLMKAAHFLPQIGLAVLTILLLFRRVDAAEQLPRFAPEIRSRASMVGLVLAQLVAFILLERRTAGILEQHLAGVEHRLLAIGVWAAFGLAATLLGVLLFLPLSSCLWGFQRRAGLLLGVLVLGLTAWWAGYYAANDLSEPLRIPTLWLTDRVLGLFETDNFVDVATFVVGTPDFHVDIVPQCSGFEGMGLMAVFSISYVWIFRSRLRSPQLLLLPLLGIASVWMLNVVRIVALVLIGTHISQDLALGGFHMLAGTLAFCLAALGLVVLSRRLSYFSAVDKREQGLEERDATAAYLTPFLLTVALGMIITAFGEGGRVLLPAKVIAPAIALWVFRGRYAFTPRQGWGTPLLLGAVAFAIWVGIPKLDALRGASTATPAQALEAAALWGGAWLPIKLAASVCVVPLVEELAFRGYLLRRLTAAEFETVTARQISILAWVISALLFGVLHEHWVAATLAGGLYGFAYMRRGQLFDCVLAHAFTNLLLVVLGLASGDWTLV